jgi:hypothetical protein
VLVAEDHPINLKYMGILLDRMGHEAVFCENGAEALQWLAQQTFDVVLLDYHMPVLDGLATTEAIRQLDSPAADIKVILVTADVVNDTRKRALDVGVSEFASKPLQANDLQRALQRCGLLDEPDRVNTGQGALWTVRSAPIPLYDMPVHFSEHGQRSGSAINTAAYAEIVSMLPKDTMDEMLSNLLDPPQGTLHALIRALEAGEHRNTSFIAHNLKGTAMLLGFTAIARTAAEIEHLVMQNQDLVAPDLIAQLLNDLKRTREALHRHNAPVEA